MLAGAHVNKLVKSATVEFTRIRRDVKQPVISIDGVEFDQLVPVDKIIVT